MSELKEKMINTIKESEDKSWFTIPDFQGLTGATASEIITVINSNSEFVKSNKLSDNKLSLYSTREEFNEKTSLFDKLKGAFKNTLD
jgi:hypothetical protein